MPHHEFLCLDCKRSFNKIIALVDYEQGDVVCRGSKKVEQRWSAFTAITSEKERLTAPPTEAVMQFRVFGFLGRLALSMD